VLGNAEILLGTQGWNYESWMPSFYPHGTKPSGMLDVYARAFGTVEVDSTAYGIPSDPAVRGWRTRVPPGFVFALKVPQAITHERRLKDTTPLLRRFLDRVAQLDDLLGPLLVQLSPGFRATEGNRAVLRDFVGALPTEYRWAIEFRHPGWMSAATFELLKSRNVATVLVDGRWIRREFMAELAIEPTADFSYVRWMGTSRNLTDFSRPLLHRADDFAWWSEVISTLAERVQTVYGYASNTYDGHAPHSVRALQQLVGQVPVPPEDLREQGELFQET